ncbi:hypothetical protein [Jatrophihabitans sp.]|uniref:hypothetical protein n=1 Tax=Jatrophihabitans sp. TaxID=1932789 RepID=UPI0030C6BC3A|nr:hypothetical protein [Jatrophihabitans sp.]
MRIHHPITGQTTEVDDASYDLVYKIRGWEPAAEPPTAEELAEVTEVAKTQTIQDVLDSVGDDPDLAAAALEAETAGKNRKTLVAALTQIATPPTSPDPHPASDANPADADTTTEENQA